MLNLDPATKNNPCRPSTQRPHVSSFASGTRACADITIRQVRSSDAFLLLDMHSRLSSPSLYFRYLSCHVPDYEELARICQMKPAEGTVFVAILDFPWETAVGLAYYTFKRNRQPLAAEPAIIVADRYQGQGLGTCLMRALSEAAQKQGVQQFEALVHPNNAAMISVFAKIGSCVVESPDDDALELRVTLDPINRSTSLN